MAFCKKCGAQLEEGTQFCSNCGKNVNEQENVGTEEFVSKVQSLNQTEDTTSQFSREDIQQNKVMAVLAYLGILVLIPILAAPNSKFARYHANQGLVLVIVGVAYTILNTIITSVFYVVSWGLGSIISSLLGLASLVFVILAILGIVNAASGKAKELPVIGKITILK